MKLIQWLKDFFADDPGYMNFDHFHEELERGREEERQTKKLSAQKAAMEEQAELLANLLYGAPIK